MLLGAHFSIRDSLSGALSAASDLGCRVLQIFAYRRHEFYYDPKLAAATRERLDQEVAVWRRDLAASGVERVLVHSRALALLSLPQMARRSKAIEMFRKEVELASLLGAHAFVFHLGPYSADVDAGDGLKLAGRALVQVLRELPGGGPRILLENVPGGGRRLGATVEEIASLFEQLGASAAKMGVCLDIAHCWTAGYPVDTPQGWSDFFARWDAVLDRGVIEAFHLNNSALPRGCHLDRHAHLQEGHVTPEAYAWLLEHFKDASGVLETPKEPQGSDRKNLDFLLDLKKRGKADWSRGGSNP